MLLRSIGKIIFSCCNFSICIYVYFVFFLMPVFTMIVQFVHGNSFSSCGIRRPIYNYVTPSITIVVAIIIVITVITGNNFLLLKLHIIQLIPSLR